MLAHGVFFGRLVPDKMMTENDIDLHIVAAGSATGEERLTSKLGQAVAALESKRVTIESLEVFAARVAELKPKTVKPTSSFKGTLELGELVCIHMQLA